MGHWVGKAQFHHLVRQQPQGPAGPPLWRGRAGHRDAVRFLLARQLAVRPRAGVFVERPPVLLDKPLPGTSDGRRAHIQGGGNLLVAQAVVSLEQDTGAREPAGTRLPAPSQLF